MCIVLVTTAHPDYAVIIIDNRDEFITRPTSRPHWWTSPSSSHQTILSSRDLQRAEKGTWLGITKTGNFAVLTNFRETDTHDVNHPVKGERSRGGMVTAWLTAQESESTEQFVHRLLDGEGVKGVGGFSLVCGKLRRKHNGQDRELEPLAIISNRCENREDVPWIAGHRNEVCGLSNTSYLDPVVWPKVHDGKELLLKAVKESVEKKLNENELVDRLYGVLDTDTLPAQNGQTFEDFILELKNSIFIPSIGGGAAFRGPPVPIPTPEDVAANGTAASEPIANGHATPTTNVHHHSTKESLAEAAEKLKEAERPDPETDDDGMHGIYGTQRQTIILVDWEGNVSFRERSLWDAEGKPIPRGKGDLRFEFEIDGWHGEKVANGGKSHGDRATNGLHVEAHI